MANRKVLINRHTSGSTAPNAAEMYKGEIAVAHETGKETLWTKNNNDIMVPFISCAQTISIIEGMIETSEDDVKAATGETHIEVATGDTGGTKVWTLSSKDVQSEEEFKAYSAATDERIETIADALGDLTNIVVTDVKSGDNIINVEPNVSGNSEYTITHKTGHESSGFNKLATDAYGHVTASSAVTTADIEALGFKTSADTDDEIAELSGATQAISGYAATQISQLSAGTQHDIEALSGDVVEYVKVVSGNIETVINELSAGTLQLSADTHNKIVSVYDSATSYADDAIAAVIEGLDSEGKVSAAGKYLTGIGIADGKISGITEADIPVLSVESAGTGNVVSQITVDDHKITYNTVSVATSTDIQALSASVINLSAVTGEFSGATDAKFTDLSGATQAISGYAHDEIAQLSGATQAISGYAHDEIAALSAGTIQLSADTVAYVNQLSGYAHGEIVELSGAVQANETDIDNLSAATLALSAVTLTGVSLNNTPLTVTDHVVSVPVADDKDDIAGATATGNVADAKAVKDYVEDILSSSVEYKGATASAPAGTPSKGDLYIASGDFTIDGKNVETGDFIIYDGTKWDVIEKNLDGAITGNLTADTVTLGNSTNSVKSLANGSAGQVLTMVNGAPAWADDPELTVVSAGTGNVLTDITVDDHEITFTKGVTAADQASLNALSAGTLQLSADTYAAINALSANTHNSMIARDDAVFASAKTYADERDVVIYGSATSYADDAIAAAIEALDSVGSASTTGHYLTSVTITDGKITAVGEQEVPAATPVTTVAGTTGDTASAVLTGIATGGTDGHQLTLNATNKIFSAETSDSAITSVSAQTSISALTSESALTAAALTGNITSGQVSDIVAGIQNTKVNSAITAESADTAASAEKVANALSISGYATSESSALDTTINYDGSQAKSLTFGTNTAAGKSMSMTSAGVVDVEIIDCGEY